MDVLDKLLFNLQTIASVQKGKKISTVKEFIIIEDNSLTQGFWRWKYADSRDKTVNHICREVRTTIAMAAYISECQVLFTEKQPLNESNYDIAINTKSVLLRDRRVGELKKIRSGLLAAKEGISNICYTYSADADVSGRLKPLIDEICDCMTALTQLLINIGEFNEELITVSLMK